MHYLLHGAAEGHDPGPRFLFGEIALGVATGYSEPSRRKQHHVELFSARFVRYSRLEMNLNAVMLGKKQ